MKKPPKQFFFFSFVFFLLFLSVISKDILLDVSFSSVFPASAIEDICAFFSIRTIMSYVILNDKDAFPRMAICGHTENCNRLSTTSLSFLLTETDNHVWIDVDEEKFFFPWSYSFLVPIGFFRSYPTNAMQKEEEEMLASLRNTLSAPPS